MLKMLLFTALIVTLALLLFLSLLLQTLLFAALVVMLALLLFLSSLFLRFQVTSLVILVPDYSSLEVMIPSPVCIFLIEVI